MKDSVCQLDVDDNVSSFAPEFAGDYYWADRSSGGLLDFERLTLSMDGSYVARVVATLVNPGVRSFGQVPCMLPEEGEWNVYLVSGQLRLRVRPTTGRARVYSAAMVDGTLAISRRGTSTNLFRNLALSGEIATPLLGLVHEHEHELQLRSA